MSRAYSSLDLVPEHKVYLQPTPELPVYDSPPEPVRDWSFGFITGHRLRALGYLVLSVWALYMVQYLLWPRSRLPVTFLDQLWSWGSLVWLVAVIPGTLGFVGMLAYFHPRKLDEVRPIKTLVSWRIVSRGTNGQALISTIRCCQEEMRKTPLFPYIIEVAIDEVHPLLPPPNDDLRYVIVPKGYVTPNNSRFKARALHYACLTSLLPDRAWIVHLDEETHPTSSGIKGICRMIEQEERSKQLRIGQGAILYHRQWKKHPFLTLADNVRTGDDFARYYFQSCVGITTFGLHGSYIVVRNDIEKAIGFDFGPNGDITEDAFWAMVAMEQGRRCRWVEGYLEEQSTYSVMDFLKQRRRWFQGLVKVSLYAPVKLRWRFCLGVNTALWALAPFSMLYTVAHFFYGFETRWWVHLMANCSFASFMVLYLIGLKTNMDEHRITSRLRRAGWTLLQVLLVIPFSFMESAGVLWALMTRSKGFHVVKK